MYVPDLYSSVLYCTVLARMEVSLNESHQNGKSEI